MAEEEDVAPVLGNAQAQRKMVVIRQINQLEPSLDAQGVYPSDNMPPWFVPLQPIIEDLYFQGITITRGSEGGMTVEYKITTRRTEQH